MLYSGVAPYYQALPTAAAATTATTTLPYPWQTVRDPASGHHYYYNAQTGATQWEVPTPIVTEQPRAPDIVPTTSIPMPDPEAEPEAYEAWKAVMVHVQGGIASKMTGRDLDTVSNFEPVVKQTRDIEEGRGFARKYANGDRRPGENFSSQPHAQSSVENQAVNVPKLEEHSVEEPVEEPAALEEVAEVASERGSAAELVSSESPKALPVEKGPCEVAAPRRDSVDAAPKPSPREARSSEDGSKRRERRRHRSPRRRHRRDGGDYRTRRRRRHRDGDDRSPSRRRRRYREEDDDEYGRDRHRRRKGYKHRRDREDLPEYRRASV